VTPVLAFKFLLCWRGAYRAMVWQAWSHAAGAARNQALTTDSVG
jgi:hypothetical protein